MAKAQYGLQAGSAQGSIPTLTISLTTTATVGRGGVETKGMHPDNEDTGYKQALLARLTQAFRDERFHGNEHAGTGTNWSGGSGLRFESLWTNWAKTDLDTRFSGILQRQFVGGAGVDLPPTECQPRLADVSQHNKSVETSFMAADTQAQHQALLQALQTVVDPNTGKDFVSTKALKICKSTMAMCRSMWNWATRQEPDCRPA